MLMVIGNQLSAPVTIVEKSLEGLLSTQKDGVTTFAGISVVLFLEEHLKGIKYTIRQVVRQKWVLKIQCLVKKLHQKIKGGWLSLSLKK